MYKLIVGRKKVSTKLTYFKFKFIFIFILNEAHIRLHGMMIQYQRIKLDLFDMIRILFFGI